MCNTSQLRLYIIWGKSNSLFCNLRTILVVLQIMANIKIHKSLIFTDINIKIIFRNFFLKFYFWKIWVFISWSIRKVSNLFFLDFYWEKRQLILRIKSGLFSFLIIISNYGFWGVCVFTWFLLGKKVINIKLIES